MRPVTQASTGSSHSPTAILLESADPNRPLSLFEKNPTMQPIPIRVPSGAKFDHLLPIAHERAIRGAAAANRPLLIRGEPGVGKSQVAYAAASLLRRPLKTFTINANTESQDLLWSFDAVARLAESQILPKSNSARFNYRN